jgi:TonB family protein
MPSRTTCRQQAIGLPRAASSFAVAALLVAAIPSAHARDWPETAGWTVLEGDDFCGMSLEFEGKGETELLVGQKIDGTTLLIVSNYGWSTVKGEKYDLTFQVDRSQFGGGSAVGSEEGGRKGFATRFQPGFWSALKTGTSLRIFRGNTLVDHLNLQGSAAAGSVVDRCLVHVRSLRDAEERERRRFSHIPDDPFAPTPVASPPKPLGDPANWLSADDYPAAAIAAGHKGRVEISLTVDKLGKVAACKVKLSSGSSLLDDATCSAVTRRARFRPATADDGRPIEGSFDKAMIWALP